MCLCVAASRDAQAEYEKMTRENTVTKTMKDMGDEEAAKAAAEEAKAAAEDDLERTNKEGGEAARPEAPLCCTGSACLPPCRCGEIRSR